MTGSLRVLALTRYGALGASSRVRFQQYFPWLDAGCIEVDAQFLLADEALAGRYSSGKYTLGNYWRSYTDRIKALMSRGAYDVLWIEKEALPWWPLWFELPLLHGVPFVLDYDDAVFHNYDRHRSSLARLFFGRRLDGLMAKAKLVVAGNGYLAKRARAAGAPWVEVVPTVVDLARYSLDCGRKDPLADQRPRIVWIGSPATVNYLQLLRAPLLALAQRVPFVLRVIGGGNVDLPGVDVEVLPWTESSEVQSIAGCDVGVMPLLDTPWERGKCGYKLIQYMACKIPVVASAVGVNTEIVHHGSNGFLVDDDSEWVGALECLLTRAELREKMGMDGRTRVEAEYCIQKTGPRMAELLRAAARGK